MTRSLCTWLGRGYLWAVVLAVVDFHLPSSAWAQMAETSATPVQVLVAPAGTADGRSAVSVSVQGGPAAHPDELRGQPVLPSITCPGATVLPATKKSAPALVPPAKAKAESLDCVAHYRGARAAFRVPVRMPGEGLYAEVDRVQPQAGEQSLRVRPFTIGKGGDVSRPRFLRAGVSAGSIAQKGGRELEFVLPDSTAPHALAVAITDGSQGGAVFLPLIGKTTLPVKTTPKTEVRVRIAGTWFGPVLAKEARTSLPISVPPGIRIAVVQAVGRRGNVNESFANLKTPKLPRIAAVAAKDTVAAGETLKIFVALASPRGAAAPAKSALAASAMRGKVNAPVSQGGGLWLLNYRADNEAGPDQIEIFVDGDSAAGRARLALQVTPASANKIVFDAPKKTYAPGELVTGIVRATDAHGNLAPAQALKLTFAGSAVAATESEGGASFQVRVPEILPADRQMSLVAKVSGARGELRIMTEAGPAVEASIGATPAGRRALVRVRARDRFGNLTSTNSLSLIADEATATELVDDGQGASTTLRARTGVRSTLVRVLVGDRELARTQVSFDSPANALLLGAYAHGAWTDNLGELSLFRVGGGLGVRRGFGPIESSLLVGVEAFSTSDTVRVGLGGMDQALSRSLQGLAVPVILRGRVALSRRMGVALSAGLVPVATSASLGNDSSAEKFKSWTLGGRGQVSADLRVGPAGRALVGASWGRARVSEGPVVGDVDGIRVFAGYEWWPLDLGP